MQFHRWNQDFLYLESLNDGTDHGRQEETYKCCLPKLNATHLWCTVVLVLALYLSLILVSVYTNLPVTDLPIVFFF